MPAYYDPNADGTNNAWTKSTGTTGWNLLDDAVRSPTAPDTGADYISESTDGDLQDVQFSSGTFVSGTYTLYTYCAGGTKRKIEYAIDTGAGFGGFTELAAAGAAAAWRSVGVAINNQGELDAFAVRYRCTQTGGGPNSAAFIYAAYLEGPTADRRGQVSWAELETPDAPRRGQISWAELETPDGARRGQVSWVELETPDGARRGQVSWAELEVPDAPRRGQVSWAELETPDVPRRGQVSWVELETPDAPRRGQVSWVELETPDEPAGNPRRRRRHPARHFLHWRIL